MTNQQRMKAIITNLTKIDIDSLTTNTVSRALNNINDTNKEQVTELVTTLYFLLSQPNISPEWSIE
jgi:helix-turn-helix protein